MGREEHGGTWHGRSSTGYAKEEGGSHLEDQLDHLDLDRPSFNSIELRSQISSTEKSIGLGREPSSSIEPGTGCKEQVHGDWSELKAPKVDLKPLPKGLRYAFLGENSTYPVIVNSELKSDQLDALLVELRKYRKAIGYTLDAINGISPNLSIHRIHLEDETKSSIEPQRRLNPNLKEVVKKEILKLFDAGIIYPISDSTWISPVH
ncbi:unnamed protein product [Microthlaspi erraticum]|uniref:Reverse transcriptase domain-containing protein n=1 Tax=Microthlaspi erraticum TaxID=1685480 RepID=A0A6D2K3E7_9BRAS|nr:unnamed protein product [Microthlaspi erraticum]